MAVTLTNPEALPKVDFFRQVAIATGSKLVFMAGQVAWDADRALVGKGDGTSPRMLDTRLCGVGQRSRCWQQAVLVVDRGHLAEVGVAPSGVVAVRPTEHRQPCFPCTAPTWGTL